MINKVLYTSDFGTRLWISTDYGYCGKSILGIHRGQIVSGLCRDLKDSIELKHIDRYSDIVRLAQEGVPYSRGFGHSEQLFTISEASFANLLGIERRIAAEMAVEQAAISAEKRAAAVTARRAAVAAAIHNRIKARRRIPVPQPILVMAHLANRRPIITDNANFRMMAQQFARTLHNSPEQLVLAGSRIS